MTQSADQVIVRDAVGELGRWGAELEWSDVPTVVRQRLQLVLLDSVGVMRAGARLPEQRSLVAAWSPPRGDAVIVGSGHSTVAEVAAWLNATAMVSLEMDEGNKYAAGHPAAHGFPAVLALGCELDTDGATTAVSLLVAYEVAARFGRACSLKPGVHPHGNWGIAGAAAGCARLLGLDASGVTAAIDCGSGMPVAGHFGAALDGNPVRNAWMGASNLSGLAAARLAQAGVAHPTGVAALTLGDLLGRFDTRELTDKLNQRWDVTLGYFKQHASCSYTHPAADAALELRGDVDLNEIDEIVVEVHSLAAALDRLHCDTRLGAMFSIPFVVASALTRGAVGPDSFDREARREPGTADLAKRVRVVAVGDLDRRLPAERPARIRIRARDGGEVAWEVPNPIGDAEYQPFDEPAVLEVLTRLLGPDGVAGLTSCVGQLPVATSTRATLASLADP
jgi:2-methylcitrate dehydratase PrpD